MKRKRKRQIRLFSIVASLLMVFSLITPGFVGAASKGDLHTSLNDNKKLAEAKISKDLQKELSTSRNVKFLVKFKDKADLKSAVSKATDTSLSAYSQELRKRSAVISELKTTAKQSQQGVMDYLKQAEAKGIAKDVRSFYIVNGLAVTATKEVAEKIAAFPEVEAVVPNYKRELLTDLKSRVALEKTIEKEKAAQKETLKKEMKDPSQSKPGKKEKAEEPNNTIQEVEWNVERVGAPDVWSMGYDGTGIVVAAMDTGMDWDHPALMENYRGYDPETGDVDHTYSFYDPVYGETVPYDLQGHGTHVTGTMVGNEADGSNMVGVAPGAKWIGVQAFSETPDGVGAYDEHLIAGAEWLMAPGGDMSKAPAVVNNSWGGGPGVDEWFQDMVIAWREAGIMPVFAAGNTTLTNPGGPGSVSSPGNYPESFAVGATDSSDNLASFSLEGPSPYGEIKPDISAPGVGIRSSVPGGGYAGNNGTSMAAPAVAGVVALLKQVNGDLTVDQMEQVLMETADSEAGTDGTYPESPNNGFGYGIVDAFAAYTSMADGLGTIEGVVTMDGEDTEAPTYSHEPPNGFVEGGNLGLSISVSDNVSITSVEVSYDGITLEASQVSGDHRSGDYSVSIPGEDTEGKEEFTYHFIINDFGGNEVVTEEFTLEPSEYYYYHDFETEPEGWTTFQGNTGALSWEWGEPTYGPDGAVSGDNVYATNLSGDYNTNEFSWLDMPALDLPVGAHITFDAWYDIENSWDNAYIAVTNDPLGEYQVLDNFTGNSGGWQTLSYDLSDFGGQDVYIAFIMESDFSVTYPGLYIDNVIVSDQPEIPTSNGVKSAQAVQPMEVPLDATVSVLETGRSTNTNPADGSYSLLHQAGTYTVVAETYGFYSNEQTVTLEEDGTEQANFVMEELPTATVSGTVTSANSGNPVADATLLLVEDANVEPVATDANGNYDLSAYEGDYTLRVIAEGFHSKDVELNLDGDMNLDIALDPFFTIPGGEIGYDDGTAENARAYYDAGNKWAVKMSLDEGQDSAIVTDGVFQFHGTDWPVPGDTPFAVEVWSAGDDGMPDELLAGPVEADAIRDLNEWTVVDLREHNIQVNGDFFMVYVQTQANPNVPGLATDEDGPLAERSYQSVGGTWGASPAEEGNYMIRARVDYAVGEAAITSPEEGLVTNESTITVEGTASPTTTISLKNNGEEAGTAEIGDDGAFAIDVELTEGENELTALTVINGEEANESDPVTVTLDTAAPDVTITNPEDGDRTDRETVTVEGTVSDDHLDRVTVNGQEANVDDEGNFSKRILLDLGENVIEVVATDLAGNATTEEVTITAGFEAPEIENITPEEDQYVESGDSVRISFEGESGQRATFSILMPLTNVSGEITGYEELASNTIELPFMDMFNGTYVAYWRIPDNIMAEGAVIEIKVIDEFGNETRQQADGKLFINTGNQ